MSLPAKIRSSLVPLPGLVYLIRDERPDRYGLIHLPAQHTRMIRSAAATIAASSSGLYGAGDRVLVASGVGRRMEFSDRVTLYIASEDEILARLADPAAPASLEYPAAHPLMAVDDDERRDEGDAW